MLLDYKLKTPEERTSYVQNLLKEIPKEQQTPKLCETLSNYILDPIRNKTILTDNRLITVNKRETSFEGLSEKFESNEDAVYDLITDNTNQYLVPKIAITQEDIDTIPELAEIRSVIEHYKKLYEKASGRRKYFLKKQIIEFCRDQYTIKQLRNPPTIANAQRTHPNTAPPAFPDSYSIDPNTQEVISAEGHLSLGNPAHVSLLLTNYSQLKQDSYEHMNSDMHYLLQDLESCADAALETQNPIYYEIMILKIDGLTNKEIHEALLPKFGKTYTPEYISCIWRQKIPKLIAEEAKRRYLDYHFIEEERGKWKRCNRCGQIKLMHPLYFSKNCTSKDGFYSICKDCRKKRQSKKAQEGDEKINGGS